MMAEAGSQPPPPPSPRPGLQPPPATFFGALVPGNPVIDSFESELRDFLGFMRRLRSVGTAAPRGQELHRRGANTLFNIWIKYKPRLPDWYYNEKLLKVGDLLIQIKEYKLALLQCYGRYLQQSSSINLDEVIADVNQFKSVFFPNGFGDKSAALTFHALQGRNICIYQMLCISDRNLQNQESLQMCFNILSSLRLIMQVALSQEHLCWLIYNGTVYIYTICRRLMSLGQSAKVLEYLLWASICMESSVPLLAVHYLTWRTTLYTAVCYCYYDCQASIHGEVFARRGLSKIDELKQLESMSSSPQNSETKKVFREATIKMAVMVFKRAVYESRRKPKGFFRPKLRVNLKEAQNLPWPRTVTERLLTEMFDGTAAHFLAILEALSDSNRQALRPAPPVPDETEIRDVVSELFFAGMDILAGGGSFASTQGSYCTESSGVISASSTLLQLILTGKNGVSGEAAMKFIKLAFSYEEWDVFDSTIGLIANFLQNQDDPIWKKAEMELRLIIAMQPLVSTRRSKHGLSVQENIFKEATISRSSGRRTIALQEGSLKPGDPSDDLVTLATTVFSCVCTSKQTLQPDKEILVDIVMFLWQKCKVGVQRIQMSGSACLKYIYKFKAYKWVHILWIINEVIHSSNIIDANVVVLAEVTLRLTAIMENIADCANKSAKTAGERSESVLPSQTHICDIPEILKKSPAEQLHFAYENLEKAINGMNTSRLMTILPDGKSVLDTYCTKKNSNGQNMNASSAYGDDKPAPGNNFVMDLHLELIQAQHRVAVKLLNMKQGVQMDGKNLKSTKSPGKDVNCLNLFTESDIMNKIKKNKLSKAIFLMQKAILMFPKGSASSSQKHLLEEALALIQKVEAEQNALYSSLKQAMTSKKNRIPPPPLLLSRSHCSMTFKPAPFTSDVQVSWYSILGCVTAGSNLKVRLNNHHLPNAGEEIPADGKSLLEIKGLDPNEKYIFAVAAYSSDGKLIGDAIGETTKPILAYPPLSATTARAYLTQIAYQTDNYTLAKKAFSPLWDYFVLPPSTPSADPAVISASNNLTISQNRLCLDAVSQTSPILLHLFLRSIFIINEINVKEGALFCDSICSKEILYNGQVARLAECERMVVAIELSNWLNDANYALQSVVQCYGLLAPIIYHKIASVPVVQILIKCLTVLQEVPSSTLQRKQTGCYESIQHMIACSSFYTAQVLRSWKEYELALIIINYGKKLLDSSQTSQGQSKFSSIEEMQIDTETEDEVLAHRGGHWTLLQNTCRELWNHSQEALSIAKHSHSLQGLFPITRNFLISTIWLPFYLASDAILDMIIELQTSNSLKIFDPEGDFCVPSCVGGIADEDGGSNLTFCCPLDDISVVDLRWICGLVLRTIELMYQMKKWEALVHIAMHFNTVTHERYAEQVTPLLVYAQRQLLERIQQFGGPDSPQPHFIKYQGDNANKINCRNFIGKQLRIASTFNEVTVSGHHFVPEMPDIYTDGSQAQALVCVPLDVTDTLKCFRETLEKSKYHSRALRHSRKLLSLFLAHTQETFGRVPNQIFTNGKVEFSVGAELTFLPKPPDLSQEKYNFPSMVESRPLPESQLSVVVSSYEKTIEILQINNQRDLKVQALHELGNLHFYAGKKRSALKYWCQALDETLKIADVLNNWQELDGFSKNVPDDFTDRSSKHFSEKCIYQAGIWGCLHAAVLAAKIAQYILTSSVRLRTKCCIFSAILFKTLFKVSIPHPTADCDFAQYEIHRLIPGIDLFSDRYRADVSTVVASLSFLIFELHCAKQNLIVLPLFTLYQYFVSEICRDPVKCIEGRILKIKVLTDLGFFAEAFYELCLLNHGEKIPWKVPAGYRLTGKMMSFQKFNASKPLLSNANLQVLEDVFNWSLPPAVVSMCDQQIMNKLTLAKMHFIICLSATINSIPEKVMKTIYSMDNTSLKKPSRIMESNIKINAEVTRHQEQSSIIVQLVRCKDELNMAMLKGILLTETEERLNSLVAIIQNEYDGKISRCSAVELETVIEAKLQLAVISQQRHQTAFSAALAFSAIRLLQDANIFRKNVPHIQLNIQQTERRDSYIDSTQLPCNVIAREHMNIRLWLRCRMALVTALTAQIRGIGDMKENDMTDCSSLINEVIIEAEAFSDIETQAEVLVQVVILDLQERRPVTGIKLLLQDIINLLQEKPFISPMASLTLVKSMLLLADILTTQTDEDTEHHSSAIEQLNLLILAHKYTIKQIFTLGAPIKQCTEDPALTSPVVPLKNNYLPAINLLAKVKMRIAHALAQEVASTSKRENPLEWLPALSHLETALDLCRTSATRELDLEAEILFQKGKVERQIIEAGNNKSPRAAETLLDAIKVSQRNDQNFGLIRKSYLEIALLYFHLATYKEETSQTVKIEASKTKTTPKEHLASTERIPHITEVYRTQAWIAVRAATQVSEAMLASQLLIGKKGVKGHQVKAITEQNIPEFASMDLLASYKDFLSDGYEVRYKNLMASSIKNEIIQSEKDQIESEGTECNISKDIQRKQTITWVHLIRYHNYLIRHNMSPLFAVSKSTPGSFSMEDALFTSVFDTGVVLRLAEMHFFLKKHLYIYSTCCLEDFPKQLQFLEKPGASLAAVPVKMSLEILGAPHKMSTVRIASTVSFCTDTDIQLDNRATIAPNKELCIQWYIPSLEKSTKDMETMVLLLYAYNTKYVKIVSIKTFNSANVFSGHLWIPLTRIISLHEKLSNVKQQIEILVQSSTSFPLQEQSERQRRMPSTKSKINLVKVELDEKIEEMLKQCLCEVKALLCVVPDLSSPLTEVPFDVTLLSIQNLEKMFDPANGCVIAGGSLFSWVISLLP
ncbi:cilia- and flagella-associated protein 54 [Gopherus flavomarginatus]|uniref:cilia- and flagella-associated protein 54 n=1 Tax=Gopherus flavomarginatus TaxID=286002 RepID=UPI0021CC384B|nr:cilia- and flagella-associated protein 54 [Gopherus flavomarginatus]